MIAKELEKILKSSFYFRSCFHLSSKSECNKCITFKYFIIMWSTSDQLHVNKATMTNTAYWCFINSLWKEVEKCRHLQYPFCANIVQNPHTPLTLPSLHKAKHQFEKKNPYIFFIFSGFLNIIIIVSKWFLKNVW